MFAPCRTPVAREFPSDGTRRTNPGLVHPIWANLRFGAVVISSGTCGAWPMRTLDDNLRTAGRGIHPGRALRTGMMLRMPGIGGVDPLPISLNAAEGLGVSPWRPRARCWAISMVAPSQELGVTG